MLDLLPKKISNTKKFPPGLILASKSFAYKDMVLLLPFLGVRVFLNILLRMQ
jgi:hypothetical protein